MADCGDRSRCGGGNGGKKSILLYACSGAANVAEAADRAARELMFTGEGMMFCLAGLSAGVEGMIEAARQADLNVVIDGCEVDCGKMIFENCGLTNYIRVRVTDLGIEKVPAVHATPREVATVVLRLKEAIEKALS